MDSTRNMYLKSGNLGAFSRARQKVNQEGSKIGCCLSPSAVGQIDGGNPNLSTFHELHISGLEKKSSA